MVSLDVNDHELRHAHVGRDTAAGQDKRDVEWVILLRREYGIGDTEICLEYRDSALNEMNYVTFDSEDAARQHANGRFGLSDEDWCEGGPPSRHRWG